MPPSTYLLRPRRLIFVDEMTTMEQLNNEIRALQDKNVLWETQLTELLRKRRIEELEADQKQELADDIKSVRKTISDNNDQILENKKQITAKERQIAADKEYRLKRGEQPLHR